MPNWLLFGRRRRTPTLEDRILEALRSSGPLKPAQIARYLGTLDFPAIEDALHLLEHQFLIERRFHDGLSPDETPWGIRIPRHRPPVPPPPAA